MIPKLCTAKASNSTRAYKVYMWCLWDGFDLSQSQAAIAGMVTMIHRVSCRMPNIIVFTCMYLCVFTWIYMYLPCWFHPNNYPNMKLFLGCLMVSAHTHTRGMNHNPSHGYDRKHSNSKRTTETNMC